MDGFFDKYGRMIIIAVAICFVLLYLTPMRNVVGSSINGFAGNFANKVGESLGTVKMPDGSDNIAKEKSSMLIKGKEFNSKIPSEATTVIFTDEKAPKGVATTDLTVAKDGDVVGWLDGTTWKVSTQDHNKAVNFNKISEEMFKNKNDLTNIEFNNVDTSKVEAMSWMFEWCVNLREIDLSNFDTSNVTNMSHMFEDCKGLTSLNLSNFDTSNVTNMVCMFDDCEKLKELELSSFNTSKVENMASMFYGCHNLKELNLSTFNTSKVTTMMWMFWNCTSLEKIDLSSFDTSKVTNMHRMFRLCSNLTSLDLSSFDTSKVTDMSGMFEDCYLRTIKARSQKDVDNFKTKNTWADSSVKFEIA